MKSTSKVPTLNEDLHNRKREKHQKNSTLEETVRQWIGTLLGVELDRKASFAKLFKNGALLCEVLNKLQPGTVKKIDLTESPFKQMANIQSFLDGCKLLGMKQSDLFATVDLFEEKDIMNVITTVYVLGMHVVSIKGYSGPQLGKPPTRKGSLRRRWTPVKLPQKPRKASKELPQPTVAPLNLDMVTKQQFKHDPLRERTARQWIEEVVGQSFPYASFARSLKDGMLLCKTLNAIQPGTVLKINSDVLPFKQMENIESYIKGCVKVGIPASGLFDTNDLYEEKDINSVIDNIHALAKHAQKIGYQGPHIKTSIQSTPNLYRYEYMNSIGDESHNDNDNATTTTTTTTTTSTTDTYDDDTLALITWVNNTLKKKGDVHLATVTNISRDFRDGMRLCMLVEAVTGGGVGLYVKDPVLPWHAMQNIGLALQAISAAGLCDQLVSVTGHAMLCGDKPATIEILHAIRGLDVGKSLSSVPVEVRGQKVIEELIHSEKSYVAFLTTVWETLVKPLNDGLSAGTPILKKEEIFSVFGNWEDIWKTHTAVVSVLETRLSTLGPTTTFGDVFVDNALAFQSIYSTYIGNFDGSGAKLKRLRRANERFEKLMLQFEQERAKTNKLDLSSYLITPIQRLPRYLLLIRQMLEYIPDTHPDYKCLLDAKDHIEKVTAFVNTSKVSSDNIEKLQKIEGSIIGYDGPPISDYSRKFVREGFLHILGMEEIHTTYFFLLSDMVLYCKYKPGGKYEKEFKCKAVFPLSLVLELNANVTVEDPDACDPDVGVERAFELVTEQFCLVLLADTVEEKLDWLRDIKSCL